jgi:DnaJ-class molecular chaperone
MTFDELQQARDLLGLPEQSTRAEVTACYRRLVKETHPDLHGGLDDDRIRQITAAYRVLRDYCDTYTFSFSHDEFLNQNPEERLRMQFANDPLWGGR